MRFIGFLILLVAVLMPVSAGAQNKKFCDYTDGGTLQGNDIFLISRNCAGTYKLSATGLADYVLGQTPGVNGEIFFRSGGLMATASASDIRAMLSLHAVAVSGAYTDLSGKPILGTMATAATADYYTAVTVDSLLSGKAAAVHAHVISDTSGLQAAIDGKQTVDATLTAIAGVTTSANKIIYATGADTFSLTDLTAAGRALLDDSSAADQLVTLGAAPASLSINTQTSSYSLVLADATRYVRMNLGSANNLTVPLNSSVAFPTGTQIIIRQVGAGQTTIVATGGVTVNTSETMKLRKQGSTATLIKVGTDEWDITGDLEAAP